MKCLRGNILGGRWAGKLLGLFLLWTLVIVALYQLKRFPVTIHISDSHTHEEHFHEHPLQRIMKKGPRANQTPLTEKMLLEDIEKEIPNVPIVFWKTMNAKTLKLNATCALFPNVLDLEYNNVYWQTLRTSNGTFQLLNAYLDIRTNNQLGPTVRILGMMDRIEPAVKTYCQFWFENQKTPVISETFEYKYVWVKNWGNYKQGIYQPYLIACVIPEEYNHLTPMVVSLVEKPCDNATNALKVIFNKPEEKKDFAVCVKGLDFPTLDLSVRLAEWIELLNILGADKVFMYELEVHPNVRQLLSYYEDEGMVEVTPLKLAGGQPNGPLLQYYYLQKKLVTKRQNELIPYNDCFYKHMYEYKYIVLLDTDEVIVPTGSGTWQELMDIVVPKSRKGKAVERASFNARNVYFLDDLTHKHGWFEDIPKYMHMLQHVYRAKNYTKPGYYIKSFFNTEKVLTLHNHYPLACLGSCYSYAMETEDVQLQHYRRDCVNDLKRSCADFRNNSVLDTNIWKYKEPLMERVALALKTLGFSTTEMDER